MQNFPFHWFQRQQEDLFVAGSEAPSLAASSDKVEAEACAVWRRFTSFNGFASKIQINYLFPSIATQRLNTTRRSNQPLKTTCLQNLGSTSVGREGCRKRHEGLEEFVGLQDGADPMEMALLDDIFGRETQVCLVWKVLFDALLGFGKKG